MDTIDLGDQTALPIQLTTPTTTIYCHKLVTAIKSDGLPPCQVVLSALTACRANCSITIHYHNSIRGRSKLHRATILFLGSKGDCPGMISNEGICLSP